MMRTVRNCNCAIIGGAGFLGSHLVEHLINDRGCDVLVVDNLVSGRREWVPPRASFAHADITESEDHLRWLFAENKIRFVWNLAAWPYIVDSFSRPLHVFNVNANGAIKVINAAQEAGCEGILQISSAELYGNGSKADHDDFAEYSNEPREQETALSKIGEDAPVCPHSTYGAAKAAVDYYCQCAWRERKTPVIALRQFNCVGERDDIHPYVAPVIYRQLAEQKDINVPKLKLGNNSARDFLYAGDAVRIMVEVLERGELGTVYNSGSETSIKIYDLAKLIGKVMGFTDVKVERDEARVRPWEIWALTSSNDKLRSIGVGPPKVGLEEALRRTVKWFDERKEKWLW